MRCVSRLHKQDLCLWARPLVCSNISPPRNVPAHATWMHEKSTPSPFVPEMFWTCVTGFLGSKSLVIKPSPSITLPKGSSLWLLFAFSCKRQEPLLCQDLTPAVSSCCPGCWDLPTYNFFLKFLLYCPPIPCLNTLSNDEAMGLDNSFAGFQPYSLLEL